MVKIGIDIMGGDYAPLTTLEGVVLALKQLQATSSLYLIGEERVISGYLEGKHIDPAKYHIVPASQRIEMDEHPVRALQQKPDSSLAVGFNMLADTRLDVFASAGHSGAVMVGALNSVKQIPGVLRPCVASAFPLPGGSRNILLDVGINADCKPEMFVHFARLGSVYAQKVFQVEAPRVALLNSGSEEGKGNILYQKAYQLLKSDKSITFVGNLEPRDFFDGIADVTVCDGFTGNIVLKQTEAFYKLLKERKVNDKYLNLFNYEQYGGTPVLGINENVLLGHGISSGSAICNMILASEKVAEANLAKHIKEAFK